jgi:hypothetical protein
MRSGVITTGGSEAEKLHTEMCGLTKPALAIRELTLVGKRVEGVCDVIL